MTLSLLREVRHARLKPGIVMVVLADLPRWFDETDPRTIVVRPADDIARMDWRPTLNLLTAVFCRDPNLSRFLAVLDALQKAGATLFGAATEFGIFPLLTDATEDHERLLRRGWEALCRC